jgi:hypothetical protein
MSFINFNDTPLQKDFGHLYFRKKSNHRFPSVDLRKKAAWGKKGFAHGTHAIALSGSTGPWGDRTGASHA